MTEKKQFRVHIIWYDYEKTRGEITLYDGGQPILGSECIEDVQYIKQLLNELYEENQSLKEFVDQLQEELVLLKNAGADMSIDLTAQITSLKLEKERLKKENEEVKNFAEHNYTETKKIINNLQKENEQLKSTIKDVVELLSEEVDLFSDKATEHDINAYIELREFDNKDAYYMAIATKKAIKMLKRILDD